MHGLEEETQVAERVIRHVPCRPSEFLRGAYQLEFTGTPCLTGGHRLPHVLAKGPWGRCEVFTPDGEGCILRQAGKWHALACLREVRSTSAHELRANEGVWDGTNPGKTRHDRGNCGETVGLGAGLARWTALMRTAHQNSTDAVVFDVTSWYGVAISNALLCLGLVEWSLDKEGCG